MQQQVDGSVQLTKEEWACVAMLAYAGAAHEGEDVCGGLMKWGAFHLIGQGREFVDLAGLIENGNDSFDALKAQVFEREREARRTASANETQT